MNSTGRVMSVDTALAGLRTLDHRCLATNPPWCLQRASARCGAGSLRVVVVCLACTARPLVTDLVARDARVAAWTADAADPAAGLRSGAIRPGHGGVGRRVRCAGRWRRRRGAGHRRSSSRRRTWVVGRLRHRRRIRRRWRRSGSPRGLAGHKQPGEDEVCQRGEPAPGTPRDRKLASRGPALSHSAPHP